MPNRGEIWLAGLPAYPDDPHQPRPVLILSEDTRNEVTDFVIAIPLFSRARLGPTRVVVAPGEGGLEHEAVAFCEEITTLHHTFLVAGPLGGLVSSGVLQQVALAVRVAIGDELSPVPSPGDIDSELDRLGRDVLASARELASLAPRPEEIGEELALADAADVLGMTKDLLDELRVSPAAAILLLSSRVEAVVRDLLRQQDPSAYPAKYRSLPMSSLLEVLRTEDLVPASLLSTLRYFVSLRNEIVHSSVELSPQTAVRAIDYGVEILRLLQSIPRKADSQI